MRSGLRNYTCVAAFIAACTLFTACSKAPEAAPQETWDHFRDGYLEAYFKFHPDVAVNAGRHEFDGKLPDYSKQSIDGEIARLHAARDRAASYKSGLTDAQRFERDYLISEVDSDIFWLETAQWPYRNPYYYNWTLDPTVYLTRPYAPLPVRMQAFIGFERSLPPVLKQIEANLRTPMPRSFIDQGHLQFGGLADFFQHDVPTIFLSVKDPDLQKELAQSNATAVLALRSIDKFFDSQRKTATNDFGMGADLFQKMLHATELVDMPLDQLRQVGQRDLDRNLTAMKDACAQLGPGKSLPECVAMEENDKPTGKPVEAAREQLKELRAFVLEKNLVTIPGTEEAQVEEAPPYERFNFAYINIPGPYEKNMPSIYYIAPPDPKWPAAEQKAYLPGKEKLLFVSAHEVMPGHFLQFLHANRSSSKLGQVFVGYAFAEGWAHYVEELVWEAGIHDSAPKTHVGQLQQALLRDVRFLSAIGLHTGKMTMADSEKMFREAGLSDAGNARQQAARGTFDPEYLKYTLGKLMIRKLRDDWTASRGGRNAWHDFHDQFLQYGGPPIPLVRSAMLGANPGPPL